jgi:hypothetical protein
MASSRSLVAEYLPGIEAELEDVGDAVFKLVAKGALSKNSFSAVGLESYQLLTPKEPC